MSDMKAAAPSAVNLASQIGEEDRFRDKLLRLAKENKVAVVSAAVILLFGACGGHCSCTDTLQLQTDGHDAPPVCAFRRAPVGN